MWPVFYLTDGPVLGPASLPLAICFVAGFRAAKLPGLVALMVIGSHSLIGHKEFSFIYDAIPLMLVVAGLGAAGILNQFDQQRSGSWIRQRVAAAM